MFRLTLALALFTFPAWSADHPSEIARLFNGGDQARIEHVEGQIYKLIYVNDGAEISRMGDAEMGLDNVHIELHVKVKDGPEHIVVTTYGPWVAFPVEMDVPDGSQAVIKIMPAMY